MFYVLRCNQGAPAHQLILFTLYVGIVIIAVSHWNYQDWVAMFRLITLSTREFLWCSDSDPFFHCLKVDPTAKSTGNRVWTIYDVIWCHWFNGLFFWIGPQDSGLPGHRMASSGLGSPARKLCKKNAEQKATWAKTHGTDEGLREHNRSPQKQRSNGSFDPFVWKRGTNKNLIDYSITFIFIHFHSFSFIFIHFHSFSFIFIHFHSFSFIFIHFHSFSFIFHFIFIHFHSFSFIFIHFHSFSFIFIHFHSFSTSFSFIFIHFHSFSFIFIHFHSLSFIFIHFHSFSFIFIHFHSFSTSFSFIFIHFHSFSTSFSFIFIHFHSFSTSKLLVWIPFRIGFWDEAMGFDAKNPVFNPRRQARGELSGSGPQ